MGAMAVRDGDGASSPAGFPQGVGRREFAPFAAKEKEKEGGHH